MKVHLGINIQELPDYKNLDPCGGGNKIPVDPSNLDMICEDSECELILADEILDYIHGSKLIETIRHWCKKLRHKGKIILGGTDLTTLSKTVYSGNISIQDANKILFGLGNNPWNVKVGCYTCFDITNLLEEIGLKIITKKLSGIKYVIEAYRE